MIQNIYHLLVENWSFFSGLLWEHVVIALLSSIIAIILGLVAGILLNEYRRAVNPTMMVINFLYTIPSISMLGFLIPFSGIGNATAVIALVIYALLPMVRNTYTGLSSIDKEMIEAATSLGLSRAQRLRYIELPLAFPVIMVGIRNMLVMTIALTGVASFIGAGGLGVAIYRGITTNNTTMTVAGSLLIAFLALIMDAVLGFFEKIILYRGHCKRTFKRIGIIASIVIISGIGVFMWPSQQSEVIHVATKPMTEQLILGDMLKLLIEQDTDLTVEVTAGVGGGTSNIQPAMESGQFDIYPEYTGTGWNAVLKRDTQYSENLFDELQRAYEDTYQFKWVGMYGFNNTYGLAVRKDIANKYNLKTYSDLARVSSQLILGGEYDFFGRQDGYSGLQRVYGMDFKDTKDMDIGLKYQAIESGHVDAMPIFTTDGQLSHASIVVLEDDKHLYPSYVCGNVVRIDVLKMHPELESVLLKLTNTITDQDMSYMNYEVESEGQKPHDVAERYLRIKGLLY